MTFFFFSWNVLEFNSKKICHHLTNWMRWNNRVNCHGQGKIWGKNEKFQGQGKVREFFKNAVIEIFDIVKVIEKSGKSVFRSIVHKFSSRLWNAFSFGKDESMLQSKHSDQFDTLRLTYVVVVVSGFRCEWFLPNSFFLFPRKSEKRLRMKRKMLMACKKNFKANVNIDCFSFI